MNWYKKAQFDSLERLIKPDDRLVLSEHERIEFRDVSGSQGINMKPKGLWYGCGLAWFEWCAMEMPHWLKGNVFKLELNTSRMLLLKTGEELLEFSGVYGVDQFRMGSVDGIDWSRVASKYSGIEICPYQGGLRMDSRTSWYYSWDVASGCVWGSDAVIGATRITRSIHSDPKVRGLVEEREEMKRSWGNPFEEEVEEV